jgi:restriction endonuclease S subunit
MAETFTTARNEFSRRWDPAFFKQSSNLKAHNWPVGRLGDYLEIVQYGSSSLSNRDQSGTPILRMNNIRGDAWVLDDIKFVHLSANELERYRLVRGDILLNRTNGSPELVGKSAVFAESGDWVFASYLIRLRVRPGTLNPHFVAAYLNSSSGRSHIFKHARQILQTNISASELRELPIPVPSPKAQEEIVGELRESLGRASTMAAKASQTLANLAESIDSLVQMEPDAGRSSFAMPRNALVGTRLDPVAHHGTEGKSLGVVRFATLADLVCVDPKSPRPDSDEVPFAGLPEFTDLDVSRVLTKKVASLSGRKSFRKGDLLVARIEPSVFNKKYPWARSPKLSDDVDYFTSSEFYVLRSGSEKILAYLSAALRSRFVQQQIRGFTTGSSGRRRLDRSLLMTIRVPIPPIDTLVSISSNVMNDLFVVEQLLSNSLSVANAAKAKFNDKL